VDKTNKKYLKIDCSFVFE